MRNLRASILVLGAVELSVLAFAQKAERESFGAVVGSVSCADTNLPARMTRISLQPVPPPRSPGESKNSKDTGKQQSPAGLSIQKTHLDGTFVIPKVKPGVYYVVVQKPGYLSPVAQFSWEEIDHPTDEVREQIAKLVPMVTVNAKQASRIDVQLVRAATISGTIRYDDGAPVPETGVGLTRRSRDGKWASVSGVNISTDDLGAFRATGLPAGEYRLNTTLNVEDRLEGAIFGNSESTLVRRKYSLEFYFGDTFHKQDAKVLKLESGQDLAGADFTIPVSKLHTITGSLVEAHAGRAINAGKVVLYTADDNTQVASAEIDPEEQAFRFEFVPEGEYVARVEDARDVTREEIPAPPGDYLRLTQYKEAVMKSYGKYEGPFSVQTDLTGVTFPIPEKETKSQQTGATP